VSSRDADLQKWLDKKRVALSDSGKRSYAPDPKPVKKSKKGKRS